MASLDLNLSTVELTSTLLTAPLNGAPSSSDYNESQRNTLVDLTSIVDFINNQILPLINALPAGALLPIIGPVGIEGRTVWSDTSDQSALFFNSLSSTPLSLADSLRLLNGIITTMNQQLIDQGVEVASLQAQLSSTNQNDVALALQNLSSSLNQLTINQNVTNTTISGLNIALANLQAALTAEIARAQAAEDSKMTNVLTTTGDLIYASSGSTASRLPIGSEAQVLSVVGGIPTWSPGLTASTLESLSDVDIATPANGDVLTYDTSSTKWVNQQPSATLLESNGVANTVQDKLNLTSTGSTVVITSDSSGNTNLESNVPVAAYMIGPGLLVPPPAPSLSGTYPSGDAALDVIVSHFSIAVKVPFNTIAFAYVGASAGIIFTVGLYSGINSAIPGTLLWSSPEMSIPFSSGSRETSVTSFIIEPGDYYLAATTSADAGGVQIYGLVMNNVIIGNSNIVNNSQIMIGKAANSAATGAILPSTLGTLSGNSSSNGWGWPVVMFYEV